MPQKIAQSVPDEDLELHSFYPSQIESERNTETKSEIAVEPAVCERVSIFFEIGRIWEYYVNARQSFVWKHDAGIYDHYVPRAINRHHILADFAQAT